MPNKVMINKLLISQLLLLIILSHLNESHSSFLGPIIGGLFPPRQPPTRPPPPPPSPPPKPFRPAGLKAGFYIGLCPVDIEAILKAKILEEFKSDPSILPAFLRMQFHDCFVRGCDASILINGDTSEKKAGANLSVRGYEVIDRLKAIAEAQCPGLVSCADLIAIITSEVLKLAGGPIYAVQTGRCDGLRSDMNDADVLPSPFISSQDSIKFFGDKGFNPQEMVVLLGCHTVGISHCIFFQDRLYPGTQFYSTMDPTLRTALQKLCPKGTSSNGFTFLDQNSTTSDRFDNSFFNQIRSKRAILRLDQDLADDPTTGVIVKKFADDSTLFNPSLADAMLKLQAVEVLTGNQGEIRRVCSSFN